MSRYRLRFSPDPGSGTVLWCESEAARSAFGDPVPDLALLPLRTATRRRLEDLAAWYDTSLDWRNPGGPSLWSEADATRFRRTAARVLEEAGHDLGPDFQVRGAPTPAPGAEPPLPGRGVVRLEDRRGLESFFRKNPALHVYELGDLDEALWPETAWYALEEAGYGAAVLGYHAIDPPCYLAMTGPDGRDEMEHLLRGLAPALPEKMYLHLTPGLEECLRPLFHLSPVGLHSRMALPNPAVPPAADTRDVVVLGPRDHGELRELYSEAYPDGWFDPRFLARGRCHGLRRDGRLVSVAGLHAWSGDLRVAALGNVATLPAFRGQRLARRVVAHLAETLVREDGIETLGLNVKEDNGAAIRCYEALGFKAEARFGEWMAWRREESSPGP